MPSLPIRQDLSAAELRTLACKEGDARVSRRLLAIAMALDGISRAEAARQAEMDRQTLRDWVTRYNAGGVDGLRDRDGSAPPADTNGHHKSVLNGFGMIRADRPLRPRCARCINASVHDTFLRRVCSQQFILL